MRHQHELKLQLACGERSRVLVEAGSALVLLSGSVDLLQPPLWLGEHLVLRQRTLSAEEMLLLEEGGWIELAAKAASAVLVIAPDRTGWWSKIRGLLDGHALTAAHGGKR